MNTPIVDFVDRFRDSNPLRFHMPGHKGKSFLGCESGDITEIRGADSLYEAEGIILESEKNASMIFQTGETLFSVEGSSQCIKAMIFLLLQNYDGKRRPYIIAARNSHKSFLYAAALLDLEVIWIYGSKKGSICSCHIAAEDLVEDLENIISEKGGKPIGVYLTTPDYLGNLMDIKVLSQICHERDIPIAVDNAHGSYLHFLEPPIHPMDLGADLCCDSAHKTLPVLTGGAYLHLSKRWKNNYEFQAKQALSLFGSTSPSYLVLQSLDLCNKYLNKDYQIELENCIRIIRQLKDELIKEGVKVMDTEPLKLTVYFSYEEENGKKLGGDWLAKQLERLGIYCEYSDPEYLVFMFTPQNTKEELLFLEKSILHLMKQKKPGREVLQLMERNHMERYPQMSVRQAVFSLQELIPVKEAVGRICAAPVVSCPPAIPIVASGEVILPEDLELFEHYGIDKVCVVKEKIG